MRSTVNGMSETLGGALRGERDGGMQTIQQAEARSPRLCRLVLTRKLKEVLHSRTYDHASFLSFCFRRVRELAEKDL